MELAAAGCRSWARRPERMCRSNVPRGMAAVLVVVVASTSVPARSPAPSSVEPTPTDMGTPPAPPAECPACGPFDFKDVPPVRPMPRLGNFQVFPTGPGYYSLLAAVRGRPTEGLPKFGYFPFGLMPPSYFDADWRYLDDPKTPPQNILDEMKRIHLGNHGLLATGGSAWFRYMNEYNSRLTQANNDYGLTRARGYADLWYEDRVRLYTEGT